MTFPHHPEAAIPDHVQALIFDCDGTLVDTMPIHFAAWTKALEPYGITMGEKRFYQYAGMPTAKIIEILSREQGIAVSPERVAEEKENLYLEFLHRAAPIDDVIAIARREQGHRKLAVASGGWRRIVEAALNVVGVLDLFPVIVGADDVEHGKPHPDVFLEAARRLGVAPEHCLVYEDGELGFEAARRAGMQVIDVRPWYMNDEVRKAV